MVVALGQYDWSLAARRMLILDFFQQAVRGQGTDKHQRYIEAAANLEVIHLPDPGGIPCEMQF